MTALARWLRVDSFETVRSETAVRLELKIEVRWVRDESSLREQYAALLDGLLRGRGSGAEGGLEGPAVAEEGGRLQQLGCAWRACSRSGRLLEEGVARGGSR